MARGEPNEDGMLGAGSPFRNLVTVREFGIKNIRGTTPDVSIL